MGRQDLLHLTLTGNSPSLREVQAETGRACSRSHGGMLLTGLLSMSVQAAFLIHPRDTTPRGLGPPTSLLPTGQLDGGIFSTVISLYQDPLVTGAKGLIEMI